MSAEDSSLRTVRVSPSHQRNGHHNRTGSVSRMEEARGSTRQNHPEHLSTGSSFPAAKCSSTSYIHYNDIDSDYNMQWDQSHGLNSSYRERVALRHGSGSFNGALQAQQEPFHGRIRSSSKHSFKLSHDFDEPLYQSWQNIDKSPVRSPTEDLRSHNRERHSGSPLTIPQTVPRTMSPTVDCFHQPSGLAYAEQNGCGSSPIPTDEGRYSPMPSRSSRSHKSSKVCHHVNSDPIQGASYQGHDSHPVMSRAERMAALERRMVANGLSAPGRSRSSSGHRRKGHGGVMHMGAVQMSDYCTTSGSESSESEVEMNRVNCSIPQTCANPAESNAKSAIPRNKFSFGSLQLDEESDEDGCHAFGDEEGGQIFSC